MRKRRKTSAVAAVLTAGLTIAACTNGTDGDAGTAEEGGEINIAWSSQPPTLDPGAVTTTSTNFIAYNVFEGLLGLDENLNVEPVLAESWSQEDYQTFTFELRSDVTFHNGEPVTSEDVVASLERWLADSSTGTASFVGAEVEAVDEHTVVLRTSEPVYTAGSLLAQPTQQAVIMPADSIAEKTDTGIPTEYLFGTGPFMIGEVVQDQSIELERFEDYVSPSGPTSGVTGEKAVYADNLTFHIVPDQTTRMNGLASGQYDFAADLSPDNAAQFEADPNLELNPLRSGILTLLLDKQEGALADQAARQAVQAGLDIEAIMAATYGSDEFFDLNGALAPTGQEGWYTEAGLDSYNQADLAEAKDLLADSDYDGEPVRLVTTRDYPYMYSSAIVVEDQLNEIGFTVELEVTDWAGVLDALASPEAWDATSVDFLLRPTPTALSFFNPEYFGGTDDPAITQAINAINSATSTEDAAPNVDALQEAFFEYVPVIKFGEIRNIVGQRSDVDGFIPFLGPVFYSAHRTTD